MGITDDAARMRVEGVECVSLVNRVACLSLPVVATHGAVVQVELHDGRRVWVRPMSQTRGTVA